MKEHFVLIFAYHYPPENTIGAARPLRFSKYLSKLGYKCRVFTAADQAGRNDPNTQYVPDPFFTRRRDGVGWHLERAVRKVFLPDELGMRWSYHASRAAREFIAAHPGGRATIISTFPPIGSHLAGWQLAQSCGLPWIADLRDAFPVVGGNPFKNRIYQQYELATLRRAHAIIANTDAARDSWHEKFPSMTQRVHLIWNGFDPEQRVTPLPTSSSSYRVLSHTGELYDGRSAEPILESIQRLISSGRLSPQRIRVRLIGPAETGLLPSPEFLERARAAGWLELIREQIPQREALQIARSADGLLLLSLRSALHIPAKIFEYLQIGRPILAFIRPNSPAERLLERSGVPYRCVYPGSAPESVDDVVAGFFELPSEAVAPSPWFEHQFNAENQIRQLDAIIRSLHDEPMSGIDSLSAPPIGHKTTTLQMAPRLTGTISGELGQE